MKKIKLGIIGCGIAARRLHFPALLKLKNKIEIVAVCNHTEKKAKSFSKLVGGVPYVLDYKELLANKDVDAVDIVLPIDLNYEVTLASIKAGKHMFVEKPLAATPTDAKKLVDAARNKNVVCLLAENYRYDKLYLDTKGMLKIGAIGEVYSLLWNMNQNVTPTNEYAQTVWRKNNKYAGGFIFDGGIHNIAALRLLLGEMKAVTALKQSVNPLIGSDDTMSMMFETKNGKSCLMNLFFSVKGHQKSNLLIFGSKGTIQIINNTILVKKENQSEKKFVVTTDGGFTAEFENFYNAIIKGEKVIGTFEEGLKDVKVMFSSFESSDKRKRILL
ncbi:MAG: Gfo/Idh/MocA family oxidoreductase [bacterium]